MTEYPLGERSNRRVIFMRKSEKLFCHYLFKEYNTILLSFPKKNAYILSEYNIACSRDIPLNSSFSVFRSNDMNYGQIIHIYVYKPKDKKLLDELTKQFALFAI